LKDLKLNEEIGNSPKKDEIAFVSLKAQEDRRLSGIVAWAAFLRMN
jgi:hypothetical protein